MHIGTLLGVFPVQDEAVPMPGTPAGVGVKPMLPCSYVFDHRLFDGVKAGQILGDFIRILRDPAAELGADGSRLGPERVG
jgi:pyruvate/2-oxoglutarate dehydrogenase complex dihydrolipoamide acyltransferase (E2) component